MSGDKQPTLKLLSVELATQGGAEVVQKAVLQVGNCFYTLSDESTAHRIFEPVEDFAIITIKPGDSADAVLRAELQRIHGNPPKSYEKAFEFLLLIQLAKECHIEAGPSREGLRPRWQTVFGLSGASEAEFEQCFADDWHALAQVAHDAA